MNRSYQYLKKGKPGKQGIGMALLLLVILLCLGAFALLKADRMLKEAESRRDSALEICSQSIAELSDEENLVVQILNVGQGLSVLAKQGDAVFLYDGGPEESRQEIAAYLKEQGITYIDVMAASHYDADHVSGLFEVLDRFHAGVFYGPDHARDDVRIDEALALEAEKNGCSLQKVGAGTVFAFGNARAQVLGPVCEAEDSNNNSLVIRLSFAGRSVLLTGDAEEAEEISIMEAYAANNSQNDSVNSDILVVGHHGSEDASCEAFLAAVSPDYAVISAGDGNEYGHPHEAVIKRLKEAGITILRTDLDGAVTFVINADGEMAAY